MTTASDRRPGEQTQEPPLQKLVEQATHTYIARLQPRFLKDESAAVADLARLRRGAGKRAHQVQDLWGVGALDNLAALLGEGHRSDRPEDAEEAVFLASTLWALHQQSRRDRGMHAKDHTLGGAVRALIRLKDSPGTDDEESPLRKRLVRVGTAESLDSVAVRLREIVLLLRTAPDPLPLDYGRLAGQLYRWQHRPERAGVQREWGREFHLAAIAPRARRGKAPGSEGDDAIDPQLGADEVGTYGGYAAGE
ncbi:type I-E CRISPR-associated protein Cse2/CasB [Streptomyces sp. NPDC001966]